jgi:anaerobic magnesium-protoporphyrin IX monomethyl ester cyclase
MKNILLINPPIPDFIGNKFFRLPISLLYLSHYLEFTKTANTKILDRNINKIRPTLNIRDFEYVGISCLFSGIFPFVNEMASNIKFISPNTKVIIGGMHPTLFGEEIIENYSNIDYVVVGEGEIPLRKIISEDNNIPNTYYRKNNEIIINYQGILIDDINEVSPPWLAFKNINIEDYYHNLSKWNNPKGLDFKISIPISTTRGCPNNCSFCSVKEMNGFKIRRRTTTSVVNEIEWFYNEYNCNRFSFYDDNIIFYKDHIMSICSEIIKRKLNIQFETESGFQISKMDEDIADIMVEAGWVRSMFSIESGNDFIRNKIMGKNLEREKIFKVANYIKTKYPQVLLRALFIIGMPEDINQTIQDSYDMINELDIKENRVENLVPLPGTRVFKQCVKDNLFIKKFNMEEYWRGGRTDFGDNRGFHIKPYYMKEEELVDWRIKFDSLIKQKEYIN